MVVLVETNQYPTFNILLNGIFTTSLFSYILYKQHKIKASITKHYLLDP